MLQSALKLSSLQTDMSEFIIIFGVDPPLVKTLKSRAQSLCQPCSDWFPFSSHKMRRRRWLEWIWSDFIVLGLKMRKTWSQRGAFAFQDEEVKRMYSCVQPFDLGGGGSVYGNAAHL